MFHFILQVCHLFEVLDLCRGSNVDPGLLEKSDVQKLNTYPR